MQPGHDFWNFDEQYILVGSNNVSLHGPLYPQLLFFDFSLTVMAAPHECVIRTGQSK